MRANLVTWPDGVASRSGGQWPRFRILFVCTGNSCRSQMAEAWTRVLLGDLFEPHSAGIVVHGLDVNAAKVMSEVHVDISGWRSKSVAEFPDSAFDCVVTLSERARACFPCASQTLIRIHAGFDAPRKQLSPVNDGLDEYRRVRDDIREFVSAMPTSLFESTGLEIGRWRTTDEILVASLRHLKTSFHDSHRYQGWREVMPDIRHRCC